MTTVEEYESVREGDSIWGRYLGRSNALYVLDEELKVIGSLENLAEDERGPPYSPLRRKLQLAVPICNLYNIRVIRILPAVIPAVNAFGKSCAGWGLYKQQGEGRLFVCGFREGDL